LLAHAFYGVVKQLRIRKRFAFATLAETDDRIGSAFQMRHGYFDDFVGGRRERYAMLGAANVGILL
jgi:hypothetical protein